MKRRFRIAGFAFGAALLVSGTGALSQIRINAPPDPLLRSKNPCASAFMRFCRTVKPGEGRLLDCLDGHMHELVPACRTHLLAMDRIRANVKARQAIALAHAQKTMQGDQQPAASSKPK